MTFENSLKQAQGLDEQDALAHFRNEFYIPQVNGKDAVYLCGNSLGLQPKRTEAYFQQELDDWKKWGVEGHFHAKNPWKYYHHFFTEKLAKLVGAKELEVVCMNTLSVNLNLCLFSFYQPDKSRYKILMEAGAFPSDQYAAENIVKHHGFDPNDAILEVEVNDKGHYSDDELKHLLETDESICLLLLGGVNYYNGQRFDLPGIAKKAKENGVIVGYDLAHAVGNVPLELHDWEVDFAVWCTYKYLNSGPGSVGGVFIHQKHAHQNHDRLAGWWGHKEDERFEMKKGYIPMPGAAGWQNSNAPVFNMVAHWASLDLIEQAGLENMFAKRIQMCAWLDFLLEAERESLQEIRLITPLDPGSRGAQFSFLTGPNGKTIYERLSNEGVICDWREPNVIRIAPVPLYNTFTDIFQFVQILKADA